MTEMRDYRYRKKSLYSSNSGMEEHEQICQAIRSNGQIIGAIIIQAKDRKQRLGESEKKIALVAAEFLGKQVSV